MEDSTPTKLPPDADATPQSARSVRIDRGDANAPAAAPASDATRVGETVDWSSSASNDPITGESQFDVRLDRAASRFAIPGYELVQLVGRGGMGVVFRARQLALNRSVALKTIRSDGSLPENLLARFRAETDAIARLQHPNIVQIFEMGTTEQGPFFSMEYVGGGSLRDLLDSSQPTPRDAALLVQTLARAIHAAHLEGVVHRDLKPGNILLTKDGVPKITDFGLAKRLDDDSHQTRSGDVLGTPSYMAPEQARGEIDAIGSATDVYALGAILYEMLTGRPPFKGATAIETIQQVIREDPLSPRRIRPRLPRDLETICLKCLAKEPHRRYLTADALAWDLDRFLSDRPILARRASIAGLARKWARRHPAWAALLLVGLLSLGSLALGFDQYRRNTRRLEVEGIVKSLESAQIDAVPTLADQIRARMPDARSRLEVMAAQQENANARLHARWVLLPEHPEFAGELIDRLLSADSATHAILRQGLARLDHADTLLWRPALDHTEPSRSFRAACALAERVPKDPRWSDLAPSVARRLLEEDPLEIGRWVETLRPVHESMVAPLKSAYADPERPTPVLASVLADFSGNDPELLARMIASAKPDEFAVLMDRLRPRADQAIGHLLEELNRPIPQSRFPAEGKSDWTPVAPATVARVESALGFVEDDVAIIQALPLDDLSSVVDVLQSEGYRAVRLRPYVREGRSFLAGCFFRDGKGWRCAVFEKMNQFDALEARMRSMHFHGADLAGWTEPTADGKGRDRFVMVWDEVGKSIDDVLIVRHPQYREAIETPTLRSTYLTCISLNGMLRRTGAEACNAIWRPLTRRYVTSYAWGCDEAFLGSPVSKVDVLADLSVRATAEPGQGPASFVALWQQRDDVTSQTLVEHDLARHRDRCRELVSRGCRPAAFAVGVDPKTDETTACSSWLSPVPRSPDWESRGRRQANIACALLQLRSPETAWALLRASDDPSPRSALIHRLIEARIAPAVLFDRLAKEDDVSALRALVLALGEYPKDRVDAQRREAVARQCEDALRSHPDPGLRAATGWLCRRWDLTPPEAIDNGAMLSAPDGSELVVIRAPEEAVVRGSPGTQKGRFEDESIHAVRIPRSFALATHEVTVGQYLKYLKENEAARRPSWLFEKVDDSFPVTDISWEDACHYCRWLSEKEGFTSEQCFFPEHSQVKGDMALDPAWLDRPGYRLPTEAEWEFACRANTTSAWSFGNDETLLPKYALYLANSDYQPRQVGTFKPNDFGLFDMHGSAFEWCLDVYRDYPANRLAVVSDDAGLVLPEANVTLLRVLRGGALGHAPRMLRSALRNRGDPRAPGNQFGFRIARTVP